MPVYMSRNYNLGSRNMADAARIALSREARKGDLSFLSASTLSERFSHFSVFAKLNGIARMERVTFDLVVQYGRSLVAKVEREDLSPAYAQNLVSAVNTVFAIVRFDWKSISPTKDCGIPRRCAIRQTPTLTIMEAKLAIQYLKNAKKERLASIADLALTFGLRSKEASLLDNLEAIKKVNKSGSINIEKGTKGGRKRVLKVNGLDEINVLKKCAELQGKDRSLMPFETNWKSWREKELRKGRELLNPYGIKGFHEFRAAYAASRYKDITGWKAPANGGRILDKQVDIDARKKIAEELGHGRIDVVSEYIGSRKTT